MKAQIISISSRRHNQGFSLIEVLISFVVMAVGLLALLSFHSTSQTNIAEAKVQAEAVALAEAKLQELESFLTISDIRLDEGEGSDSPPGQLLTFARSWELADDPDNAELVIAEVTVSWADRDGNQQSIILNSAINRREPSESVTNFLEVAMNAVGGNNGNTGSWGDSPPDEQDPADPGEDQDPPADPGDEEPPGDGEVVVITQQLTISGQLTGTNAATLDDDVSIQNTSIDPEGVYSGNCIRPTNKSFSCTVIYANATGWSGSIELGTNKVFCATGTNTLVLIYTNITTNQSNSIIVANKAGQCG